MKLLRKILGVVGIGLIWAILWAACLALLAILLGFHDPDLIGEDGALVVGSIFAGIGFLSGITFGILLALAERRRAIREVPMGRAAIWGILASAGFPLLTDRASEAIITCALGACTAMALVAVARRHASHLARKHQLLENVP